MQLQNLDQWFSTLVDTLNFDLQTIEGAVVALSTKLTSIDTPPIQFLKDSLNELVSDLNKGFNEISEKLSSLDERVSALER